MADVDLFAEEAVRAEQTSVMSWSAEEMTTWLGFGRAMHRAIARARQRYAATHPDRARQRRIHTAYRARTRGRSRRG